MTVGVWKPARQQYGVAVTSFSSASVLNSLTLEFGETVHILEEYWANENTVTWLRGCTFNKNKKGIFPASYVAIKECTVDNQGPNETVTPLENAIIKEMTFVLREWHRQWKSLFVFQEQKSLFQAILLLMGQLYKCRSTLVSNTLTMEHAEEMKHEVVTMIDWGNGQLGMDLVPRVNYQQANPDNVSVVEMFRIHERSVKNCQRANPGGSLNVRDREKPGEVINHLLVTLCSFACSVGDNSEVLLSLYDSKENKYISENFVMYFTKDGQREGNDKNNSTIFTDINSEELTKDLYLVVHILRKGRLTTEGNVKKVTNNKFHYRRPWGTSVLSLRELFQNDNEQEYFLRVQCIENESFSHMHEHLIKKQAQLLVKASSTDKQNQGVTLSLTFLHGDMKNVKIENPILFSKGVVLTQRIGFPDFINPSETRNDLYLTLHGADLDRGTKTASKNVEVRVTVYNDQYELIKDCIFPASGDTMKPNFLSYVLYHNNSPKWNETIRLSIPIENFSTAHIRLELCHCSNRDKAEKKMIGFSYLTVTTKDKTARMDGKYDLCIYKCEDFAKVKNYLKYPSLRDDFLDPKLLVNNIPYHHSNREYITVETLLCSTKFAQKAELLSVLQWELNTNMATSIPQILDNLLKLKGQDLVPYLQDVLDALFSMFTADQRQRSTFAANIFEALVCIFNLLHQQMFEKFSVVLEDYLEKSFSSTLAHSEIMHCLKVQAEQVYTCTDFDAKSSKRVFRVLEDIFKFSVKSCMLSQRMHGGQSVKDFRENLNKIFEAFGKVVSSSEKELSKVQAQIINNLHKAYNPLLSIISNHDLAQLVLFILNKINVKDQGMAVIKAKTNLIKNTISSPLFLDTTSRSKLLPLILDHLMRCLLKQLHLDLVVNTLGDLLTSFYKLKETCDIKDEVTKVIQGVFNATIRTLWNLSTNKITMTVNLLVACLTEMLRLMDVKHYQTLLGDLPKQKVRLSIVVMPQKTAADSKEFLNRVLMVFRSLVRTDNLPLDWTTMKMITNSVLKTSIQFIAEDLTTNFLQGPDFDKELWYNFFLLAVDYITQPALQLEKYSEAKSSQIKNQYNDLRIPVGCHIYSLWNQLGENKQYLILELIGPFLKSTMVPQIELRKSTIPIFFDIMQSEYKLKHHLRRVEGLMIQELDSLVLEHHGDIQYKNLFESILLEKVQAEPELQEEGRRFVTSITDLLVRLLDYREIMDREEQRDTKMHLTFNILNFYKDSRQDMYIRYISRLHELHYTAGNFVEAGLTLQLHAHLLSWSKAQLQPEMSFPKQTEAARKEGLIYRIIDCFDKGKAWEYGIPLCKELAKHYEETFEYKKLSEILQKQAHFLNQILEGIKLRQEPIYYRVAYLGNTFPLYLRNKAFVYRGDEGLRLATIMNQLMTEYPNATILTTNSPPDNSYKLGDVQYIQIVSIKPVPSERPEFAEKEVPSEISLFYNTNEVQTFQFDRPYYRGRKDENNEFKSLCLERTTMHTTYKLPGIVRWYEVSSTQVDQLGPVQTATTTVKQMNAELKTSSENAVKNPDQLLRHLSMRLQGVISGAVNGGIPKYQEAFFNKEYVTSYPDEAPYIEELKSVILEQIQLLELGLSIHGKFASIEMIPLHKSLADMFIKMKSSMGYQTTTLKHLLSSVSVTSESPCSGTPSSISLNSNASTRLSISSNSSYQEDESLYSSPNECFQQTEQQLSPFIPDLSIDDEFLTGYPSSATSSTPKIPSIPRKISMTLQPITEHVQSATQVSRSDSTKSIRLGNNQPTSSQCQKNIAGGGNDDMERPPLPAKRPSISSDKFGGSCSSIGSSSSGKDFLFSKTTPPSSDYLSKSAKPSLSYDIPLSYNSSSAGSPSNNQAKSQSVNRSSSFTFQKTETTSKHNLATETSSQIPSSDKSPSNNVLLTQAAKHLQSFSNTTAPDDNLVKEIAAQWTNSSEETEAAPSTLPPRIKPSPHSIGKKDPTPPSPASIRKRDLPPTPAPSTDKRDFPSPSPPSIGKKDLPPTSPASIGKRDPPSPSPASIGKRDLPPTPPPSTDKRDFPPPSPPSIGKRDPPPPSPPSTGKRDPPPTLPPSIGKRDPPPPSPASIGKRDPPPPPLYSQSNVTTAVLPPRPITHSAPPPVPQRKPSVPQ